LRRTQTGPFLLAQAIPLDQLEEEAKAATDKTAWAKARLISISEALVELPAVQVNEADAKRVSHGIAFDIPGAAPGTVRVLSPSKEVLAIGTIESGGRLKYLRVLAQERR
jgi:tRNA U55 pseudouridine synthase TruB